MARIYIDIGHGGSDATGVDTGTSGKLDGKLYKENEVNLNIGLAVKSALEKYGHTVITERTENVNFGPLVGSYGRADSNLINSASYCKNTDCDCMVSIHNNAYSNPSARGYVLIYKAGSEATEDVRTKSRSLCDSIEKYISKSFPKNDVRKSIMNNGQDYYGILRLHDKAGVLIECGFMTNASDMDVLVNEYEKIGKNIADGINEFVGGIVDNTTTNDDNDDIETPVVNDTITNLQGKIIILNKKITDLEKENEALNKKLMSAKAENQILNGYKTRVTALETENANIKERLNEALKFDIDKDGKTTEQDAVYLIKHILEPENYPL